MSWDKNTYNETMQKTLNVLVHDFAGIRAGRANPGLLDSVFAESYGQRMKLSQLATINVMDNFTLSVSPYDKSSLGAIDKAIQEANLGVSSSSNGNSILVKLPKMTEDTRKDWIKFTKKTAENSKISIRNIRRDGMDIIKKLEKDKLISEDDKNKNETILQKLTDDFIAKIDDLMAKKEKEIIEV